MKLIEALNILKSEPPKAPQLNVYLVSGFTPLHLQTFLAAHLQLLCPDRQVQIQSGLYGDLPGNLERAAATSPDAIAIALEWQDLDPRLGIRAVGHDSSTGDIKEDVSRQLHRIQQSIDKSHADITVAISLPTLAAYTSSAYPAELASELDAFLLQSAGDFAVWASERKNIRLLNPRRIDELSPSDRWDVRSELSTGFPYQLNHASILGDLFSRAIRPAARKKGLITDLDDTLWSGIVGEVGTDGISWNLERYSHLHALYQEQLCALAKAGVLLAVASKNDPAVIEQAFKRSDLLVNAEQLFPIDVSWAPKSHAVGRILKAWNIAPDSVVFVDDSPIELAEVQRAYPDVECILFPRSDSSACIETLNRLRDLFGKQTVYEEDTLRLRSLRAQPLPTSDFLENAEAEITFSAVTDHADSRPLDLINKTNQFNLNGRRYTQSEWLKYLTDPQSRVLVANYKDKYGKLGKIAVLGARAGREELLVDIWVMSCRAFSRRIEHQCLRQLFDTFDVNRISFNFEPTERNKPLQEFFHRMSISQPGGQFTLSRPLFEQNCPALFHDVKAA